MILYGVLPILQLNTLKLILFKFSTFLHNFICSMERWSNLMRKPFRQLNTLFVVKLPSFKLRRINKSNKSFNPLTVNLKWCICCARVCLYTRRELEFIEMHISFRASWAETLQCNSDDYSQNYTFYIILHSFLVQFLFSHLSKGNLL